MFRQQGRDGSTGKKKKNALQLRTDKVNKFSDRFFWPPKIPGDSWQNGVDVLREPICRANLSARPF